MTPSPCRIVDKELIYGPKPKFDNDEFGITRVRVRYRVNFRSQKLQNKNHNDELSLGCHPRDNSHVTLRSKFLCLSIYIYSKVLF